jgi:hypothetical protein
MVVRNVSTHQVRAFATFGNSSEQHEIVSCSVTYELSGIPFVQMKMPLGRLVGTNVPATAHKLISSFGVVGSDASKVFVYLKMNPAANHPDNERWPSGAICIFEGYVTGMSFQKTRQQITLQVQARHWLSDIAYGSCLSANSHPGNPQDFLFPSNFPGAGTGNGNPSFMPSWINDDVVPGDLTSDFWVFGLHEWLLNIAKVDYLNLTRINTATGTLVSERDTNNKSVRRALARMTGGYKYVPLQLDANIQLAAISRGISMALAKQTFQSFASSTMWNKLVGDFCPNFMFAICPRVKNAYPIPYIPGYRTPWQVIRGTEYVSFDASAQMDRLLRAVGIIGSRSTLTSFEQNRGAASATQLGGYYSPPQIDDGLIMFKQAPSWMSSLIVPSSHSPDSAQYGAPTGSSTSPGGGAPPTQTPPGDIRGAQMGLMNRYAESVYVYESLHGRRASLSGKLRLDIAPGSTVVVEGTSEGGGTFTFGDATSQDVIGTVISVTINLDGQTGQAGTSFQMSHVRTLTEDRIDGFSVDRPPLWKKGWSGTSLVDAAVPGVNGI